MLVDFEYTDATHKVLKKVHLNFDNLSEEAGYILKEKAIPIEWLKENYGNLQIVRYIMKDWEKENEQDR